MPVGVARTIASMGAGPVARKALQDAEIEPFVFEGEGQMAVQVAAGAWRGV